MYILMATVIPIDDLPTFRILADTLSEEQFYLATQNMVKCGIMKIDVEEVAAARAISDQHLELLREEALKGGGALAIATLGDPETGEIVSEWKFPPPEGV